MAQQASSKGRLQPNGDLLWPRLDRQRPWLSMRSAKLGSGFAYFDSPVVPSATWGHPPLHSTVEICSAGLPVLASYA